MKNKIKKINYNHSFIFFIFCNFFSLVIFKTINSIISPLICLFLILSIGVSHGSLDHLKGKKLFKIYSIENISYFYLIYIFIATTIILLWMMFPTFSLIVFLIVASFHFGKEDTQFLISKKSYFNDFLFFLKGSLIVWAPIYFNFNETISIFKLLFIENENFYKSLEFFETNNILLIGLILSTLSSIIFFIKEFKTKKFIIFFDYFSIIILNNYFSPLIAFTIYFCFLHSIRHSIMLSSELNSNDLLKGFNIFFKKAIPLTLITATFCLICLYLLNNNYNFDSSILKVIFIGLASLTFPHILLEYLIEKNEK